MAMNMVTKRLGSVEVGGKTPVSATFMVWASCVTEAWRRARFSRTRTTTRCVERWMMLMDVAQSPIKNEVSPKFTSMRPKSMTERMKAVRSAVFARRVITGIWSIALSEGSIKDGRTC